MIKIIIGRKGSGKTKMLVDMVNEATKVSLGNVVCIEKGDTLTYSVTHKARLIDADAYNISGYGEYFGHGYGHSLGMEIHESPSPSPGTAAYYPLRLNRR